VHERVKGRKLSGIMLLTRDAYSAIAGLAATKLALGVVSGMARLALPTQSASGRPLSSARSPLLRRGGRRGKSSIASTARMGVDDGSRAAC
jgi:hypothetical protein